jgi:flagellar hook-basal body complex protein FliE
MMNIEAISGLLPVEAGGFLSPSQMASAAAPSQFAPWFAQQLEQVNSQLAQADASAQRLAAGEPVEVHDVMIQMEEAKMTLQLVMQVRSTLLEGYSEILRMSI